jgi:hypothetical protein
MSICKDLIGLRCLRKYFKNRGRHVHLGWDLGLSRRGLREAGASARGAKPDPSAGDKSDCAPAENSVRSFQRCSKAPVTMSHALFFVNSHFVNVDMDITDSKPSGLR